MTNTLNIRYLSGFGGSSCFMLATKDRVVFATDSRYKEEAEKSLQYPGWDIRIEKGSRIKTIRNLVRSLGLRSLGFESSVSYAFFKGLSQCGIRVKPFDQVIENLRTVKDKTETDCIKEAVRRAEKAFSDVKPYIKRGAKERQIAGRLEERLKKTGCNRLPFDIIVASGKNSSMPHARPTDRKFSRGDLVVIDWGGEAEGYFSDMTRTFLVKGPEMSRQIGMYQAVLRANRKAVAAVRPGVHSRLVDKAARDVIKDAGYGKLFTHGTGHGIGLEVHESPHVTRTKDFNLLENMTFTVEPGIYWPGTGGVRIEDMVMVKSGGCEALTRLMRDLEII